MLLIVTTMVALFSFKTFALNLSYSGSSTSNGTGASATTSGFSISYTDASSNICGYRFSIVSSNGLPKSGTKVVNVYLSNVTIGSTAYSSGQRFIVSSGVVANKKQLSNGTNVNSTTTRQSCDYSSGSCGFYSTLPQAPGSVGTWIKTSNNSYQNLQRIYVLCGTNLSNATESDYVLIEPIFWPKLAGTKTAATATELAIYGASVSGGDGYNGGNGNLYNAGSGTLWNLMNYINREFPNALYVSSNTDVYSAVSVISSGRYTYRQIIQYGYGCSILTVKNVVPINRVYIAYHPNGGTTTYPLNVNGYVMMNGTPYFHSLTHGTNGDPYNASTLGLTRAGYTFKGWQILGSSVILDQDTQYASTQYTYYIDSSKTTANTQIVYCHLFAVWESNTYTNGISHWAWGFNGNGNNGDKQAFHLADTTYTKKFGESFSLNESNAYRVPNGFWFENDYGTSSLTGTWTNYPFGTTIIQGSSSIWVEYDYHPMTYNISYKLNGGTNSNSNPNSYNVLYGVTLNNPTKNNAEFLGWDMRITKDVILPVTSDNWNYNIVMNALKPNVTYNVTIDSAKMLSGTSDYFTCLLYDFTSFTVLNREDVSFGENISFSITCPSYSDPDHYVCLLLYAGIVGNTSGKSAEYKNVAIQFSSDGINNGCGSYFSNSNELYTELEKRLTGDVYFIANWRENEIIDLTIVPIEPNAPYRLGTEVVTSYWIVNCANFDIIPTNNVSVVMNVYDGESIVYNDIKENTVIPKMDKNLVYFKWKIPNDVSAENLTISCLVKINDEEHTIVYDEYDIIQYNIYYTPNTQYKAKAPNGFSVPNIPTDSIGYAKWWQWNYNDGEFVYREFELGNDLIDITLSAPNSPSAYFEAGLFNIKSGYGFECEIIPGLFDEYGSYINFTRPIKQAVAAQYFYALFPEFNYAYSIDKCRTFERLSDKYALSNILDMQRQHFIPLYYPDGMYEFRIVLSDCWTPAGMLTTYKTVSINISDNAYSDWYIKHR